MRNSDEWTSFQSINARRRAVRDFDGSPVSDADVRAILHEALLAPSSGNLQPYELHWVRDPEVKRALAVACEGQRAAETAGTLVVVVGRIEVGVRTADAQHAYVESSGLDERSKSYHRAQLRKFRTFLRFAPLLCWSPIQALLALLFPSLTLLPVGSGGVRHWVARSSIYAAQTLLLAAAARGLDACPMEGFSPRHVAKILGLPRGAVVPIVIALGRRAETARIEPRWRRSFDDAVVLHGRDDRVA
ncbi:MAG: nitroreductase family protein [Polyangiaceae bacterium]|nr:nitroreductase family protein [Polyangiaceae bacterium]